MRQTERGGTERTGQLGAFLLALALLLVLTVFAHRVVLGLAAVIGCGFCEHHCADGNSLF